MHARRHNAIRDRLRALRLARPKLDRRKGTATLVVNVLRPGKLVLGGKGIQKVKTALARAGTVHLTIRPLATVASKLKRAGKARVVAKVTYTPTGGAPQALSARLTLRQRRS